MEYMICARFHSMVISALANQKMYLMSYSEKIDHVNKDLEFDLPIIHFKEIVPETVINLNDFTSIDKEKIALISESAKQQEQEIQRVLV